MRLPSGARLSEFSFYASEGPDEIASVYGTVPQSLLCVRFIATSLRDSIRMTTLRDSAIPDDRCQVQIHK